MASGAALELFSVTLVGATPENGRQFDEPITTTPITSLMCGRRSGCLCATAMFGPRRRPFLLEAAERHAVIRDRLDPRHQQELERDHGTREIKDAMSLEILAELDAAGIGIASATYEITALPAIALHQDQGDR